jgi:SAM-dependent methyltransferase
MGNVSAVTLRALKRFASHYDAAAWLDAYRLALLDTAGFDLLLGDRPRRSLLDVGAGIGDVHLELARLFASSIATETSTGAAGRARERGIDCRVLDVAHDPWPDDARFDVVSLLNVLDRTLRPLTLLERCLDRVAEGGALLLATPLPARPHVQRPGGTADPDEWLDADGETFEAALETLVGRVLAPRGLEVARWARVPYVSSGDAHRDRYELDDAALVCVRR